MNTWGAIIMIGARVISLEKRHYCKTLRLELCYPALKQMQWRPDFVNKLQQYSVSFDLEEKST